MIQVDGHELRSTGLLRQANEATFWSLGYALAVDEDGAILLLRVDPWEVIEPDDEPGERHAAAERYETFLRERLR